LWFFFFFFFHYSFFKKNAPRQHKKRKGEKKRKKEGKRKEKENQPADVLTSASVSLRRLTKKGTNSLFVISGPTASHNFFFFFLNFGEENALAFSFEAQK